MTVGLFVSKLFTIEAFDFASMEAIFGIMIVPSAHRAVHFLLVLALLGILQFLLTNPIDKLRISSILTLAVHLLYTLCMAAMFLHILANE